VDAQVDGNHLNLCRLHILLKLVDQSRPKSPVRQLIIMLVSTSPPRTPATSKEEVMDLLNWSLTIHLLEILATTGHLSGSMLWPMEDGFRMPNSMHWSTCGDTLTITGLDFLKIVTSKAEICGKVTLLSKSLLLVHLRPIAPMDPVLALKAVAGLNTGTVNLQRLSLDQVTSSINSTSTTGKPRPTLHSKLRISKCKVVINSRNNVESPIQFPE